MSMWTSLSKSHYYTSMSALYKIQGCDVSEAEYSSSIEFFLTFDRHRTSPRVRESIIISETSWSYYIINLQAHYNINKHIIVYQGLYFSWCDHLKLIILIYCVMCKQWTGVTVSIRNYWLMIHLFRTFMKHRISQVLI